MHVTTGLQYIRRSSLVRGVVIDLIICAYVLLLEGLHVASLLCKQRVDKIQHKTPCSSEINKSELYSTTWRPFKRLLSNNSTTIKVQAHNYFNDFTQKYIALNSSSEYHSIIQLSSLFI